jgi:hypothetical protein
MDVETSKYCIVNLQHHIWESVVMKLVLFKGETNE